MIGIALGCARAIFAVALIFTVVLSADPAPAATTKTTTVNIPLNIINNSGRNQNLFVYIKGVLNGQAVHVSDLNGNVSTFTPTSTPKSFALNLGRANRTALRLPQIQGARIYLSFGKPVVVPVGPNGFPDEPNGWSTASPNFNTIFDWIEYTWNPEPDGNSTLGGNTTQVDMFGFPMEFRVSGLRNDYKTPVMMRSGFPANSPRTRKDIIAAIADAGRPWSRLIIRPNNPLRVIAPNHGIMEGRFPKNQLQTYINQTFVKYHNANMVVQAANQQSQLKKFTGRVTQGALIFTQNDDPGRSFRFPRPDSLTVYAGAITPVPPPSDPFALGQALHIGAMMQGAFLRSTIMVHPNLDACRRGQFYRNAPVNMYAKVFHQFGIGKRAYAFGFDDTCDDSSVVIPKNPKAASIFILPF